MDLQATGEPNTISTMAAEAIHRAVTRGNVEGVARMMDENLRLWTTEERGLRLLTGSVLGSHAGRYSSGGGRCPYNNSTLRHSSALCCRLG